jgi:hypothetical protein
MSDEVVNIVYDGKTIAQVRVLGAQNMTNAVTSVQARLKAEAQPHITLELDMRPTHRESISETEAFPQRDRNLSKG